MSFDITNLIAQSSSSKAYLYENGKLKKDVDASTHHTDYLGQVVTFESLAGFRKHLAELTPDTVLVYGVPVTDFGKEEFIIMPKYEVGENVATLEQEDQHRVISRTRENFHFPVGKPGIFMIDIDESTDIENDVATILKEISQLAAAQYVRQYSSSSNIFFEGQLVKKPSGIHLYWLIDDASSIPGVAKIIFDRLVLAGHHRIKLASNGAMLTRSLIDMMVYQPERIDFAGGAVLLTVGLTQSRDPLLVNRHLPMMVTSSKFKTLTTKEEKAVKATWERAREQSAPASVAKAETWIKAAANDFERDARKTFLRSMNSSNNTFVIQPGFKLTDSTGKQFDVNEIVEAMKSDMNAAVAKYHAMSIIDPETEERGKTKLFINAQTETINIHSFAQGGKKYRVTVCPTIEKTELNDDIESVMNILIKTKRFFVMGDSLVYLHENGKVQQFFSKDESVRQFIFAVSGKFFDYLKDGRDAMTMDFAKFVLDNVINFEGFPVLDRVSEIPALDDNLTMYGTRKGYHAASKTYFLNDFIPCTTKIIDDASAQRAVDYLLSPFQHYQLAHKDSGRSALLAAVMTASIRPIINTAPAVMVWTPTGGQSTGKSALTNALCKITGKESRLVRWSINREEMAKRFTTHLLEGKGKAIRIENIGERIKFDNDDLANIISEPAFTGRILGVSKTVTAPTNFYIVASANNYDPSKDLAIRMLDIELIPNKANPGWLPASKVDCDKFVETTFALIDYVKRKFDMTKINTDLEEIKFDHWGKLIQYPVFLLTGHDPMKRSAMVGKLAAADDQYEILAVLDSAYRYGGEKDLVDVGTSEFMKDLAACDALVSRMKSKNTFPRAFGSLAKESGREYRYGDYILKRTGDRGTNGKQVTYSLINTRPDIKANCTVAFPNFRKVQEDQRVIQYKEARAEASQMNRW